MFKMLFICMHARSQSLSPLVDGRVNWRIQGGGWRWCIPHRPAACCHLTR